MSECIRLRKKSDSCPILVKSSEMSSDKVEHMICPIIERCPFHQCEKCTDVEKCIYEVNLFTLPIGVRVGDWEDIIYKSKKKVSGATTLIETLMECKRRLSLYALENVGTRGVEYANDLIANLSVTKDEYNRLRRR